MRYGIVHSACCPPLNFANTLSYFQSILLRRGFALFNSIIFSTQRVCLRVLLLPLVGAMLGGCGSGDSNPNYTGDGRQGIRGTAYVKNADGSMTPYADGSIVATANYCIHIRDGFVEGPACGDHIVASAITDSTGHYTLSLIPGTYTLQFAPHDDFNNPFVITLPGTVVKPRAFTAVDPLHDLSTPPQSGKATR